MINVLICQNCHFHSHVNDQDNADFASRSSTNYSGEDLNLATDDLSQMAKQSVLMPEPLLLLVCLKLASICF